jgi:hypothetical protein
MRYGKGLTDVRGRNRGHTHVLDRLVRDLFDLHRLHGSFHAPPHLASDDLLMRRVLGGNNGRGRLEQVLAPNGGHHLRDTASLCLCLYPKRLPGPCHVPGPCQRNPVVED